MSMSTTVVGFRPPDEKWQKMKAAWDGCKQAGVEPPREVTKFFEDYDPDPKGVRVNINAAVVIYKDDMEEGLEVDIRKLPKDVTIVRFVNSW
jgi:hypothetical protein